LALSAFKSAVLDGGTQLLASLSPRPPVCGLCALPEFRDSLLARDIQISRGENTKNEKTSLKRFPFLYSIRFVRQRELETNTPNLPERPSNKRK